MDFRFVVCVDDPMFWRPVVEQGDGIKGRAAGSRSRVFLSVNGLPSNLKRRNDNLTVLS